MAYEGSWANWQNRTAVGYPSSILKQAHLPKYQIGFEGDRKTKTNKFPHVLSNFNWLKHVSQFHMFILLKAPTCGQDMHGQRFGRWPGLHFLLARADVYRLFACSLFFSKVLISSPSHVRQGSCNFCFVIRMCPRIPTSKSPTFLACIESNTLLDCTLRPWTPIFSYC